MNPLSHPFLLLLAFVLLATHRLTKRPNRRLPPGPKPFPIIGNLLDFPRTQAWLTYDKWKKEYGDIVYIKVPNQHIVILNTHKACIDLLEKRSAIYSSRPRAVMLTELMGLEWATSLLPNSARWRHYRRLFHNYFNEAASKNYLDIQEQSVHEFLLRVLKDPGDFLQHSRLLFADSVLKAVYGMQAKSYSDERVQSIEKIMEVLLPAGIAGRYLVDFLPILKYVPSWVPGAGFQTEAAITKQLLSEVKHMGETHVPKNAVEEELTQSSVYTLMLQQYSEEQGNEDPTDAVNSVTSFTYLAGADTTLSAIQAFFRIMANRPEVQRIAQAEIDAVIGTTRLPNHNDIQDLPYIRAIGKELLRWSPPVPTGLPHTLTEDDVYEGFSLPKGAIVLQGTWTILRDPEVYPDPHKFDPSRWLVSTANGVRLNDKIPDPDSVFGFGRRICPGRFFAQNALDLVVANVLACFDMSPLDKSGQPCKSLPEDFTEGIVVYPARYNACFIPRSDKASQLMQEFDAF